MTKMLPKLSRGFSLFGSRDSFVFDEKRVDESSGSVKNECPPFLKMRTDKDVYRPGDSVIVTIEICNLNGTKEIHKPDERADDVCSFVIERLSFEVKGIEKLDTQWFATQKPSPGSKQRQGEQVFLDCSTPSLISNQIVSFGSTKTYLVRTELPKVIPPSYRGTAIRYLYHVRSMLSGRWLTLENGHPHQESLENLIQLEDRIPLQIWVTQKASSFLNEDDQSDGTSPAMAFQMDIYWKENNGDSEWARANDTSDGVEEGYESSRDEISSVSSYNPTKGNLDLQFEKSLSIKSSLSRHSNKETPCMQGDRVSFSSMGPPRLSTAEDSYDHDVVSPNKMPPVFSPRQQAKHAYLIPANDTEVPSTCGTDESVASEGFIRGKSYNIRLDDQVLLRFCPKNSDSTYYFSDMIGGTLTFFHEGARRCLELSITLEASETISQQFVHPSRRNSPTITKVQSDHHEVVADLVQTSFLFSIPVDGPMSFSSPHVSVQWALRFEFFTTPKNVDWTSYEHPLLIEGRDKGEWVLPITVHVPTLRAQAAHTRNDRSLSPGPLS